MHTKQLFFCHFGVDPDRHAARGDPRSYALLCCPVWELCGTEQKKFVKISHKILILNSVKSITTGTKNDTSIIQTYQIGPNCSSNFKRIEKSAILCNKKSESAQSRFVPEVLLLNR